MPHNASIDNESNSVAVLVIDDASSWVFMEPFSITLNKTAVLGIGARRSLIRSRQSLRDECPTTKAVVPCRLGMWSREILDNQWLV